MSINFSSPRPFPSRIAGGLALALAVLILAGGPAFAQCTPGLPCNVPLTPNSPTSATDGPNTPAAPNNAARDGYAACDADFMNQITSTAFMGAERDIMKADAIILKPDSVLEYSCFDVRVSQLVPVAQTFGNTTYTHKLDTLIEDLVLVALPPYINGSFSHDYLGGADAGNDSNISSSITTNTSPCDAMYNVYHVAKCSQFGLEAPFMSFSQLINTDPRQRPRSCGPGSGSAIRQWMIDLANNTNFAYSSIDRVTNYLDRTRGAANNTCASATPIPTGITVQYRQYGQDILGRPTVVSSYDYPDKFCINPGCYFDNRGNANGNDDRCVAQ